MKERNFCNPYSPVYKTYIMSGINCLDGQTYKFAFIQGRVKFSGLHGDES